MNIIIPMAGVGSRLKPLTLTTPKPLVKLSGKTIIYRIVQDLINNTNHEIKIIGFVLNQKNIDTQKYLKKIIKKFGVKIMFFYQKTPEGTAHAIYCAKKLLKGKVLVVFSDTLFSLNNKITLLNHKNDGIVFVKEVKDPSQYGIIEKNQNQIITSFIEKPNNPTSKLAIIGVYYFKNGEKIKKEIQNIISKKLLEKKEYQLTTVLKNLCEEGSKFEAKKVIEWLDCGNPKQLLLTNQQLLKNGLYKKNEIQKSQIKINQPVYFGKNVMIKNSKIGPNVSIEDNVVIENSIIKNSIIQSETIIQNANFIDSILGENVKYDGEHNSVIIGPYSKLKGE